VGCRPPVQAVVRCHEDRAVTHGSSPMR
jgi:hypothetical protein